MSDGNSKGNLGKEGDLPSSLPVSLTQEELDRMALEDLAEFNPNLADTPAHAAEHGFHWKNHCPFPSK